MKPLKARVENGKIIPSEPVNLPEGTELYLVPSSDGDAVLMADDGLSDEDRAQVLAMIDESFDDEEAGRTVPFSEVLAKLRAEP